MEFGAELHWVHYLPVATTLLSAVFFVILVRRYQYKGRGPHLLWWAGGVFCYGLGTGLEATITLAGNSVALTKAWYIAGALLGGYPLAQGTVYLLLRRRTAHLLTALTVPFIVACSVIVAISPVIPGQLEPHRPSGAILGYSWVRGFTPIINSYAVLFLIGGAVLSALRFRHKRATRHRAIGNALIAFGALLPGIGGTMAKAGMVEGLYIGEFIGLLFIWAGYACCVHRTVAAAVDEHSEPVLHPAATQVAT